MAMRLLGIEVSPVARVVRSAGSATHHSRGGLVPVDAEQPFRIERTREPFLLPHPWMVRQVNDLARDFGADLVVLDPAVPLGLIGPSLQLPYDLVLHGAEVTVPRFLMTTT